MSDTKNAKAVCILCADKLEFTLSLCLSRRLPFAINHTLSSAATLSLRQRIGATRVGRALFLKSTQIQQHFELSNDLHVLARAKRAERACGWALALLVASYLPLPTSHLRQQPSKFCQRDRRERSPGPAGQSCCGSSTAAPPRSGSSSPRPCSSCPHSTPAATSLETTASQLHSCSTPEVREVGFTCI